MAGQDNWRFCTKCYTLFWCGYPTAGVCASGGAHSPLESASPTHAGSSWDFSLPIANTNPPPASPGGGGSGPPSQDDWRFCTKCYALFWYGYPTAGVCASGGAHSPLESASPTHAGSSWDFSLPIANTNPPPASPGGGGSGPPSQDNWRFCTKCYALFWYGYPTAGVCASGGAHSPLESASPTHAGSSWDFSLPIANTNPAARYLELSEQHQQETNWCWAATTVSISLFYNASSAWTQCSLVNKYSNLTTCCQDGSSTACNHGGWPDISLPITGNYASMSGIDQAGSSDKPSFETILSEITAGHPVSIAIWWTGGGGHNPAVDGYDNTDTEAPIIDVQDPWYGSSTQDFNSFPGSYNGGATWGSSYFTK